jgi:hypothetical protein
MEMAAGTYASASMAAYKQYIIFCALLFVKEKAGDSETIIS